MKASEILAHDGFKEALTKAHGEQANASHFSDKAMTQKLAVYYQDELKKTWDHLEGISTDAKYTLGGIDKQRLTRLRSESLKLPDTFNLFAPAFATDNRLKLLGHLGSLLDQVVNHYHIGKKHGDDDIDALKATDRARTYAHYGIEKIGENFRNNITLLCDRLLIDWEDIEKLFFQGRKADLDLEDTCLKQLTRIRTTGSDPHKGGKQAYILTFSALPKEAPKRAPARRGEPKPTDAALGGESVEKDNRTVINLHQWPDQWLVYKPGDMELDTRIVGCTETIVDCLKDSPKPDWQRTLPDFSKKSLFECANADNPGLDLAVYRLLPRGCASVAARENRITIRGKNDYTKHCKPVPIQEAYGYIEFLAHRPSWDDIDAASDEDIRKSDYITEDDAEIARFYRHHGFMLALGHLIGMADAHEENARVYKRKLHLIDNEICFKIQGPSGFQTMLPRQIQNGRPKKHECVLYRKDGNSIKASFIPKDQNDTTARDKVLEGIQQGIDYIHDDLNNSVRSWLTDPALGATVARITLRPTADFGGNRNSFWAVAAPLALPDGVDDPTSGVHGGPRQTPTGADVENPPFTWKTYVKAWHDSSTDNDRMPLFPASAPAFDWTCYLNDDYPCHYKRLGSMDVMSARGDPLHIYQPLTPPGVVGANHERSICGPRYFQAYGAAEIFTVRQTRAAPTLAQLDDRGQGLNALRPFFAEMHIDLYGAKYKVVTRGSRWKITEPRLGSGGYWNIDRISADGAPLKLWVQLCRHDDDWNAVRKHYGTNAFESEMKKMFEGTVLGVADGDDVADDKITASRLDADPKEWLKPLIEGTGLTVRSVRFGSGSTGTTITPGRQWKLTEKSNRPYWFVQKDDSDGFRARITLVRDASDHPAAGMPFGPTTPTGFAIPVSIQDIDINRDPLRVMSPFFLQHDYPLSNDAQGYVDAASKAWHIKDGNEIYHMKRGLQHEIRVSVATTAQDMVKSLYDRLRDDEFANETREEIQKDAREVLTQAAFRTVTIR